MRDPLVAHGAGIVCIVFFGSIGVYALRQLFDRISELTLNETGIVDNTSKASLGFIPWSEILSAKIIPANKDEYIGEYLVITIKEPQKYLHRGNWIKNFLVNSTYTMYGSPVAITANTLDSSVSELLSIFNQYHHKYGLLGAATSDSSATAVASGIASHRVV
jgi:hypothetical protein